MLFLNTEEGYAIGWEPHIWHTKNGGKDWRSIELPFQVKGSHTRKRFDSVALGEDNALYMAFVAADDTERGSEVWRIKQGEMTPKFMFNVPGHNVDNILSSGGQVYVLSRSGSIYEYSNQISTLYQWDNKQLNKLYSFPAGMVGMNIGQTPKNKHLLVQGWYNATNLKDWMALSKNVKMTANRGTLIKGIQLKVTTTTLLLA